jgi:transposase
LSQKELQRVAVISSCIKGDLACARAAELLDLTPRHVQRLKARYRLGSAAALAHASRGRPSPRRLPESTRARILDLARTRYAGFNDHHLCEKLCEVEGLSLGRETLRRLLRGAGIGSPRKRRAPAHRQRRLARAREGEMLLLDASLHRWIEDRGPELTLLGFLDDATHKVLVAEFFSTEDARGYFRLLRRLLRCCGIPLSFYGDRHGIFMRNDDHWSVEEQLAGKRQPTQFGRALEQLGVTYIAARSPQAKGRIERLWGTFQDRLTSELRLAAAADLQTANQVLRRLQSALRSSTARRRKSLASRPSGPGSHLLLPARTRGQQRQRGAVGRAPLPDSASAHALQLCRGQGSALRITRRKNLYLSRTDQTPPRRWLTPQGVTFSSGR